MTLTPLQRRCIDLAYKHRRGHLSSALTAVGIIADIYSVRRPTDPFILSCGHAFLALAVVLEHHHGLDAEELLLRHGVHPHRSAPDQVWYTTGSLGCGITAACGFALAGRTRAVDCLISDGECAEPDVFGALDFARDQHLDNLRVHVNLNGFSAYRAVDRSALGARLLAFWDRVILHHTSLDSIPALAGLDGHYRHLTAADYQEIICPGFTARPAGEDSGQIPGRQQEATV